MTVFYLDTSAIVKRYRTEKGTEFIDRLFKEIETFELREVLRKSEERLIFVGDDEELCTAALNERIDVINPRENGAMQKLGEYLK